MNFYTQQQHGFYDIYCDLVRVARCGGAASALHVSALLETNSVWRAACERRAAEYADNLAWMHDKYPETRNALVPYSGGRAA